MITGVIKNKIDKIWQDIWAGGITNPISVIEQLTYLMFIRSLDSRELELESLVAAGMDDIQMVFPQTPTGQSMRWSNFKNKDARDIFRIIKNQVFPAIMNIKNGILPDVTEQGEVLEVKGNLDNAETTAFAEYMSDASFLIPTPQVLQKIITGLDDLYENDLTGLDIQGDLYEYMLGKLETAGKNGQFRTPLQIREMMVNLVKPTPDDVILDPACGTAGFLISSAKYIKDNYEKTMNEKQWATYSSSMFTGFDTDRTMLRISAMNLMLHSITNPKILYKDSVSKSNDIKNAYTLILANPPISI